MGKAPDYNEIVPKGTKRWGSRLRLRGLNPTPGTCVGHPTVGKRQMAFRPFPASDRGFFFREKEKGG